MSFLEEYTELILPVSVIVFSVLFGFFSYVTRPPVDAPPLAVSPGPIAYESDSVFPFPTPIFPDGQAIEERDPSAPQPAPHVGQEWIVSDEPSTFFVVQETELNECPDRDCEVVDTLFPGVYWNLPYTLSPDGWFPVALPGATSSGFVAVSRLSPTFPGRCTLTLPYRVGHVSSRFLEEGYTKEELKAFALAAEKDIEDVVGRNILSYEDDAPNTINFVISHYKDNEPFHRGLHTSNAVFPNGTVGQFWIGIYAALFDDVDNWLDRHFIGPEHVEVFKENYMKKALLHEMVHTTGFEHVNDATAVMCGAPHCRPAAVDFSGEQILSSTDVTALQGWCEN